MIIQSKLFKSVLIGPNPGDAGGAVGGAFYICKREKVKIDPNQSITFSGPSFSNEDIREQIITKILNDKNYIINFYENFDDISKKAANLIKIESIIFWFQDHMEWGPRALGNRSILADPAKKNIKDFINTKVKKRELFRPFAVAVLEEFASKNFYMNGHLSPNMNIVFNATDETKKNFPDAVHCDGTTRVQTVSKKDNKKFYGLIENFYKITEIPMLINTSMNIDTPIVLSTTQAWDAFSQTNIKSLILGNWLIQKKF